MSGHLDDQLIQQFATGERPFIQKPFTGEELASQVERVLAAK
jgi:FixJ family two-component response regulator